MCVSGSVPATNKATIALFRTRGADGRDLVCCLVDLAAVHSDASSSPYGICDSSCHVVSSREYPSTATTHSAVSCYHEVNGTDGNGVLFHPIDNVGR